MATGIKTGGRKKGTPNKASAGGPAPPNSTIFSPGAGAREGSDPVGVALGGAMKFPRYVLARVADLIPYARNARTHSAAQIEQIVRSIQDFGFTNPVLTDGKRGVIAGHGRLLAAALLGMDIVPSIELSHLSDAQRRAYVIADNKLALNAGWDDDLLRLELGELRDEGFDLSLTGFDGVELQVLFGPAEGLAAPDAAPALEEIAIAIPGDVWLLGAHRLVCGDCTDADVVAAALAGVARPHLMVTDPPYGVNYDADWRNHADLLGGASYTAIRGMAGAIGPVSNDDRVDWRDAWALFPGHVAYVWHASLHSGEVAASLAACKFAMRAQIVWVKTLPIIGRGNYNWQHEPAIYATAEDAADDHWRFAPDDHENADYAVRDGSTAHWRGSRKQSTVWFIEHVKSETGHSTQKPVECMRRPIENNSVPGDTVYDPFVGSGTTIIAGEMTGRVVLAVELHPQYVDLAVRRWQDFTGHAATLEADGRTFAAIEAERLAPPAPAVMTGARKRRAA